MTDSQKLLSDFVSHGSETAFRDLVAGYFDLVYSTAVRLVGGDTHLAHDIAQTVFVDLARLAKKLSREVRLGGWLHRHTCFVAAKTLRGERRHQFHERQAAGMNALADNSETNLARVAPIVDEAINRLGATDRAAVLLRFYERLDFRSIGESLGTNEAAAQKRVGRALEKLQVLLKNRGVTFSAAALGTALASEAVTAAPAGLAAGIAGTALATAAGTGTTLTILEFMATSKLKAGIIAAIVAASVVAPLLFQHQAQASQRGQDEALRRQTNELAQVSAENQRLAGLLSQTTNSRPDDQFLEVLRLRGEVGRLTRDVQEMAVVKAAAPLSREEQLDSLKKMYAARVDWLKQWMEAHPSEKIPELKLVSDDMWISAVRDLDTDAELARAASSLRCNAEGSALSAIRKALRGYVADNNGQIPADLSELKPYFSTPLDDAIVRRYEILPAASMISELQRGGDWVLTTRAPVNPELDARQAFDLKGGSVAGANFPDRWKTAR